MARGIKKHTSEIIKQSDTYYSEMTIHMKDTVHHEGKKCPIIRALIFDPPGCWTVLWACV